MAMRTFVMVIALCLGLVPAVQAAEQGAAAQLRRILEELQRLTQAVAGLDGVGLRTPADSIVALSFLAPPCPSGGISVNSQLLPDGTIGPFEIPGGSAFMVTGIEFAANLVPPGHRVGFALHTIENAVTLAEGSAVNSGASIGHVSATTVLPTPMRITSALCVNRVSTAEEGPNRVRIRGFLVPNE